MTWYAHVGISKIFFLDHFSPSFLGQKLYFGYRFHFEGKNDVWISQVGCIIALAMVKPSVVGCSSSLQGDTGDPQILDLFKDWSGKKLLFLHEFI